MDKEKEKQFLDEYYKLCKKKYWEKLGCETDDEGNPLPKKNVPSPISDNHYQLIRVCDAKKH